MIFEAIVSFLVPTLCLGINSSIKAVFKFSDMMRFALLNLCIG